MLQKDTTGQNKFKLQVERNQVKSSNSCQQHLMGQVLWRCTFLEPCVPHPSQGTVQALTY